MIKSNAGRLEADPGTEDEFQEFRVFQDITQEKGEVHNQLY